MAPHWQAFPEENPNIVVECDTGGRVIYVNPEARSRFPDLVDLGWRHPLLAGVHRVVGGFASRKDAYVSREIRVDDSIFEQKICFGRDDGETVFRIYAHDITALRQTEAALEALATRLVVAQEEERHRLSRELHDEAGQALAALKISMQLIRDDAFESSLEIADSIQHAIDLVEETRNQIRNMAHDLRPPALDALGLSEALGGFCQDFGARADLAITYAGSDEIHLDDAAEICLYRCLQEALTNVAVHAGAASVQVRLERDAGEVVLDITDDGVGFDPEQLEGLAVAGIGIAGMKERIGLLNGSLVIESARGTGTRVTARLPVS